MTKAFALNGAAKVYIIGRRKEKLDAAAALSPKNIIPLVGDVTSKPSLLDLAEKIRQDVGYINLLCCNSGSMPAPIPADATKVPVSEYAAAALSQNPEDWNAGFAVNTTSVAFTTFAFLTLLSAGNDANNCPGRKSQVLVTSSIAGFLRNPANFGVYPASKAATTHIVKHLAGTLVPYSIRVNGLAPGLFPSDLAEPLIKTGVVREGKDVTDYEAYETGFIPAQRLGRLEDVVGAVLYLASRAGGYVNGNIQVSFSTFPLVIWHGKQGT